MGTLTIVLPDELEEKIRKIVAERYGGRRGALSKLIEEALRQYLDLLEREDEQVFYAVKMGEVVASSHSLDELAAKLRKLGVDPRSVRVISSRRVKPVVRMGLRGRRS